ncbi:MAG: ribonuclease P protein component [Candidatus Omnitrophica bacterium]|nr:ribonuclease P protein component [Candidatus Omnitrophota bacterium]
MSLYRLTKRERLDNPHQFKNIYNFAAPKKGANFWLYCMPNGLAYNRLGISISKKICASSVGRNKFKRCIRESFRLHKDFFWPGKRSDNNT